MKSKLDDYGKGRLSVITELYDFCEKQSEFAHKAKHNTKNTHKNAHLSGVTGSYNHMKQFLDKKKANLKMK